MSDRKIRVGITHGDINGIGYEVIIKALNDPRMTELCTPIIYGSAKAAAFYKKTIENAENFNFNLISSAKDANPKRVNLINCCDDSLKVEPGVMTLEAGTAAAEALRTAARDLKNKEIDVVVTAPICKENIQSDDFHFTGHTEFFAEMFEGEPLMMMCSDLMKVGLATIHIPVSQVSNSITGENIINKLKQLKQTLIQDFSITSPKIAVLSLNPHVGDGGVIGMEDTETVLPAIQDAVRENVLAFGPFAADGFFAAAAYTKYDAILAMYHDQGLAPFKALSHDGVNYTSGLSIIRTSPAHGVGFDIAGKDKADESAMRQAIYMALDIFRSRKIYEQISANPLKTYKRETGAKDISVSDLPDTEEEKD